MHGQLEALYDLYIPVGQRVALHTFNRGSTSKPVLRTGIAVGAQPAGPHGGHGGKIGDGLFASTAIGDRFLRCAHSRSLQAAVAAANAARMGTSGTVRLIYRAPYRSKFDGAVWQIRAGRRVWARGVAKVAQ